MPAQIATATLARYEKTIEKHERMAEKLEATVAGQTSDPEHLLDVLIAAWEEMHREATEMRETLRQYGFEVSRRRDGGLMLALASPRTDQTKEDR